jgi:hypothetical protein
VHAHELRDALLGADAVRPGDEHRLVHAGEVGPEEAAEAAEVAHDAGDEGALHVFFHQPDALVAGLDVDAGGGVGCGLGRGHIAHSFPVQQ